MTEQLAPVHSNCIKLFDEVAGTGYFFPTKDVLEVGPDFDAPRLSNQYNIWHTVDIVNDDRLTYISKEHSLPIDSNKYDIVVALNVIEHVRMPWVLVSEMARICKYGGHVIVGTPCNWPYHEAPIDCWRMYPHALDALFTWSGLTTVVATGRKHEPEDDLEKHFFPNGMQVIDSIAIGLKRV